MAQEVFTGWRTVRPGNCMDCGFDDGWACDGSGNITCDCRACPTCGMSDGHEIGCAEAQES